MQRSFTFVLLLIVVFVLLAAPLVSLAQDANLLPLAERGPYHVGQQRIELVDENRDGRVVPVVLWYPAVVPPNMEDQVVRAETSHTPMSGLMPDLSNAPYPVVLYSPEYSGSPTEFRSVLEPLVFAWLRRCRDRSLERSVRCDVRGSPRSMRCSRSIS